MKISIIGLGYVGLPLAIEFGKKYETIGFDITPPFGKRAQATELFSFAQNIFSSSLLENQIEL